MARTHMLQIDGFTACSKNTGFNTTLLTSKNMDEVDCTHCRNAYRGTGWSRERKDYFERRKEIRNATSSNNS